jgi:hypothetical protein
MKQRTLVEDCTVHSIDQLTALVFKFRKDGNWIFRGVRQSSYKLIPKIGRVESRRSKGSGDGLPYEREAEDRLIRHFIRAAGPYVRHRPTTRLEWLALAQHHGMFTRLLDWTESLLVAAYFAVEDARDIAASPMIYCVKGPSVAPEDKYNSLDELDDVMLYYPPHISPRIPAQSSVFTVHRNPDQTYEPSNIARVSIGSSPLTLKFDLNACGIHKASLFPDINGLAEHESWLYKWGEHRPFN